MSALKACLAGFGLCSVDGVDGVRDFDFSALCLSCSAAAAVIGGGFGRALLPGLGDGSLADSRRLELRFGGLDGLANDPTLQVLAPPADETVDMPVEGSDGLEDDWAIKRPRSEVREGDSEYLGKMGRKEGKGEETRYVDIFSSSDLLPCGYDLK
jgi:hypothetical protein